MQVQCPAWWFEWTSWQRKDTSEKLPVQRNFTRKCRDNQLLAQLWDEFIHSVPWRITFQCPDLLLALTKWGYWYKRGTVSCSVTGGKEQPGQKSLKSAFLHQEMSEITCDEVGMSLAETGA